MNTPGSMIIGWVALLAAGGGAYYYAKKDIDARRRAQELAKTRPTEKLEWWQKIEQQNATIDEKSSTPNTGQNSTNKSSIGT
ncbi:8595_t:CDS:2 [Funneliformis mosseae]|uniref:8595_t:CDS:1 n=1 Tax=Funneliformis mosseae TaxID=27381 RepID=A0A9N8ZXG0_FUNMO|nr:8595_t:CDS:2 [Funneliformis mosseae]